jgi:CyaY protein
MEHLGMNFSERYDTTIRDLESRLSVLIDNGAEFDLDRSGDVLTIEFDDGEKFVITPQAPMEQLWVSANYAGHRFDWDGDAWIHEKNGKELSTVLSRSMSEKLGSSVHLDD